MSSYFSVDRSLLRQHKVVGAIFGMFKHNQLFQGDKVFDVANAPAPQEVA